jgi:hypothetical protein
MYQKMREMMIMPLQTVVLVMVCLVGGCLMIL